MNRDNDKGKVLILRCLVWIGLQVVMFVIIALRLYYLQVYQADRYATMADENRISIRLLIPPRGVIVDKNQNIIAGNQQNFQAMIVAEQTANAEETLKAFKKLLPLSEVEEERIKKDLKKYRKFVPIKVKDGLSWNDVAVVLLASSDMPGIFIDDGVNRYYPYGKQMAHVLGYVSSVFENDLKIDNDPLLETPGFKVGKDGIEKMLEKSLRGKGGNLKLEVNAVGRIMKEIEHLDGISGEKIVLSIDTRLQEKAFELFGEESGAAIIMNVNTGEILVFISTPSYDSNDYAKGMSHDIYTSLLTNEKAPLMNKAIAGQYSPGSVFKMIVALAALEEGIVTKDTEVTCNGKMVYGNHTYHCWKPEGHGPMNIVKALQHSCDIYFYNIAQKLGIEKIAAMARRFGLGEVTNVGLTNEKMGLIPDKEWKLRKYGEPWQNGETLITGIGQGYVLTTPIQLAVMTSMLVNGGKRVKPTFLKQEANQPQNFKNIKINSAYLDIVKEGMYDVVNKPGGTAYSSGFDYHGKKMGGKTGTTQVRRISLKERQHGVLKQEELPWKYRNHALFVGYVPHDKPKYAISLIVEHGGGGGSVAAPLAAKLMKEVLRLDEKEEQE
jgi:penicillin-binding protein 2